MGDVQSSLCNQNVPPFVFHTDTSNQYHPTIMKTRSTQTIAFLALFGLPFWAFADNSQPKGTLRVVTEEYKNWDPYFESHVYSHAPFRVYRVHNDLKELVYRGSRQSPFRLEPGNYVVQLTDCANTPATVAIEIGKRSTVIVGD